MRVVPEVSERARGLAGSRKGAEPSREHLTARRAPSGPCLLPTNGAPMPDTQVDLYDNAYSDFASGAEVAVRQETYGEDIGQSSWMTAEEWLGFAHLLQVRAESKVLE